MRKVPGSAQSHVSARVFAIRGREKIAEWILS